jgi:glyceraldehyde 3-phosphate dehydrogenase
LFWECTGFFQLHEAAQPHLDAGAKRVLISASGQK